MASASFLSTIGRRLEGKVALITGGASGVGKAMTKLFSEHGAKVVIADVQDELEKTVSTNLGANNSMYIPCNVTNEEHIQTAVDKTVSAFGKLDVMVCNAGTVDENKPKIIDNNKLDFERVLSVNVTGVFLSMKHAARVMVPARSGCIISTASVASVIGGASTLAYTSSKHAVLGLTKNLAVELGQFGIRVNCLSPYGMVTPLTMKFFPLGSEIFEQDFAMAGNLKGVTLKVDDVAKAALFLASDDAKYISGHNLVIDGGFTVYNSSLGGMFKYPES